MLIGLLLGAAGGLLASHLQDPVYQATARLIVSRQQGAGSTGSFYSSDKNLAATMVQMVALQPVIEAAERRLGAHINPRAVSVTPVTDTNLIEVSFVGGDPQYTAAVANALIDAFLAQQQALYAGVYAATESDLTGQVELMKSQIDALTVQTQEKASAIQAQQLDTLEKEIARLKAEIEQLSSEAVTLSNSGTPVVGLDTSGGQPATLLSVEQQQRLALINNQLDTDNRLLDLYQKTYVNRSTSGRTVKAPGQVTDRNEITLAQYKEIYAGLLRQLEAIRLEKLKSIPDAALVEPAAVPLKPIRPDPPLNTLVGGGLGLALAAALAVGLVWLDETIRSEEEAGVLLRLPVLARLPGQPRISRNRLIPWNWRFPWKPTIPRPAFADRNRERTAHEDAAPMDLAAPEEPAAHDEAAREETAPETAVPAGSWQRSLKTALRQFPAVIAGVRGETSALPAELELGALSYYLETRGTCTLQVVGVNAARASALLAVALAKAAAHAGRKVTLVDADLRRSAVAGLVNLPEGPGLGEMLANARKPRPAAHPLGMPNLSVITAGRCSDPPADLFTRVSVKTSLGKIRRGADLVIINSPAVAFAETSVLAAAVDAVLLVIEMDRTQAVDALDAREQLNRSHANLLGMVIL